MYGSEHWSTLSSLVKNRRAASEYLDAPQILLELKKVDEAYDQERKDRKKQLKQDRKGEAEEANEAEQVAEEEEVKEEPVMQHMLIGDKPGLPVPPKAKASEKARLLRAYLFPYFLCLGPLQVEKLSDKLQHMKKAAARKVPRHAQAIM